MGSVLPAGVDVDDSPPQSCHDDDDLSFHFAKFSAVVGGFAKLGKIPSSNSVIGHMSTIGSWSV